MWPGTELSDSTLSTKRFYFRQLHKIEQTPVFAVSETSSPSSAERGKPRRGRARGRGRGSGTGRLKRMLRAGPRRTLLILVWIL